MLAVSVLFWFAGEDRLARATTELLPGGGERVDAQFSRCRAFASAYCVVDGDTIRLSKRSIRLTGFDTPEMDARCQAEAVGAERAARGLQDWLNRGPFVLGVDFGAARKDRYGRDLRSAFRPLEHGGSELLSRYMVDSDLARIYAGGARSGWC